jgi:hypothetical protein
MEQFIMADKDLFDASMQEWLENKFPLPLENTSLGWMGE